MNKGVGGWKFKKNNIVTKLLTYVLNIDFAINRFLSIFGIILPGLSLCLICQKKSA